jgi:crotonobetainyl-CoA:carnitine CoA-transferase CaiB-like acyl-CoA transferase
MACWNLCDGSKEPSRPSEPETFPPGMLQMQQYDKNSQGPLDDIRILDLSRLVAGNMVTHVLADQGADVIKVEHPQKGDDLRNWRVEGIEIYWKVYSRNKRSLSLDIKTDEGKRTLLRLIETADVLVENFVPGTLERWGLGPEVLHARNPGLVILRISGWGQTGPYSKRPGFGTLVEAMSGYAHLNGFPDRPPVLPPLAMADMIAGLYGSSSVLAALRHAVRGKRGGQVIDLSLFEPIFSMIGAEAAQYKLTGVPSSRSGNQSTHTAPRNVYVCADGKYVALSGSMQSMAERIFMTIGHPELIDDPRFQTNDDRVHNRDELDLIIGTFIQKRTQAENLGLFEAAGVTVGPVCSIADLVDHPFVLGREVIVEMPDEDMGTLPMHNIIPRLSGTPGVLRRPAPRIGQHNAEILAELGMPQHGSEKELPA